jgi:hypothetical protein
MVGKYAPFESGKDGGGLGASAHIASAVHKSGNKDGVCDEARKPEEHGDRLDAQNGVGMRGSREVTWGQSEEGDDEKGGPDSIEDQEIDAVWRGFDRPEFVPPRCH